MTADPELKKTPSGVSVTSFSIAVNRRFTKQGEQPQTDFINIVAWRQTAEFVTRYFRKASSICVVGSIQTRSWTDNQGAKRYATDVTADEVYFVDSRGDGSMGAQPQGAYTPDAYAPSYSSMAGSAPKFEEIKTDDDLPF